MGRKRYTVEAIVRMLREAEVELSAGAPLSLTRWDQSCRGYRV